MTGIELQYKPLGFLPLRRVKTTHPDRWDELSPAQLISATGVLRKTITDETLLASMLVVPVRIIRRLSSFHKVQLLELMHWLKEYTPYHQFIIPELGSFRAPKIKLKDETFGAFIFAETWFAKYMETDDPCSLNRFIACWYRDKPFHEKDIEDRARVITRLDLVNREAVAVNYNLIREWLTISYPYVFRRQEETVKKTESSWIDVFDAVVGDDLKDQDRYAELPLSSVLRYLDKRIKKNLEDESKVR